MKINALIIRFLVLLVSCITLVSASSCDRPNLPDDTAVTGVRQTGPPVSALMESLGIQPVNEPVTPPDFTLQSIDGEEVSLSQYRGRVVMLGFWTTW